MGSLIHFIEKKESGAFYNADLFEVDSSTIQRIIEALYAFKYVESNDHLHKDNLYTIEEAENVRDKAMSLYCLLIGSFRLDNRDYAKLISFDTKKMLPDYIDADALLEIITEWATPVLMFDIPKVSYTVAFMVRKNF